MLKRLMHLFAPQRRAYVPGYGYYTTRDPKNHVVEQPPFTSDWIEPMGFDESETPYYKTAEAICTACYLHRDILRRESVNEYCSRCGAFALSDMTMLPVSSDSPLWENIRRAQMDENVLSI